MTPHTLTFKWYYNFFINQVSSQSLLSASHMTLVSPVLVMLHPGQVIRCSTCLTVSGETANLLFSNTIQQLWSDSEHWPLTPVRITEISWVQPTKKSITWYIAEIKQKNKFISFIFIFNIYLICYSNSCHFYYVLSFKCFNLIF